MSGTSTGGGETAPYPRPAALQRRKSLLSCDLPAIKEGQGNTLSSPIKESNEPQTNALVRRDSLTHMSPFSTNFTRRNSLARKSSLTADRRTSFGTVGSKITALLKAKNAFNRLRRRPKMDEPDIDEDEFKIREMPKSPRFASTLSAEAQYAMMKGYEDVVYSQLCNTYPEYRPLLRRNRTPLTGVDVRDGPHFERKNKHRTTETELAGADQSDGTSVVPGEPDLPNTSTPAPGDRISHVDEADEIRAITPSVRHTDRGTRPIPTWSGQKSGLSRHESLPRLITKHRQLVMTYRYQSAMDLVDCMKEKMGTQTLKPKPRRKSEPIKEFNSWSVVWSKEFETKQHGPNNPQYALI